MLRSIQVVLSANATSFAAQMRTASASVGQFGDEAYNMATKTDSASRKTLDTVGKLSLALGAGLAVAFGASVMVAAQFEREMRNVASISPTVQKNFDGISSSLVDMSRTMPQSAKTLASGLYDIVSSGFDGAEAMTVLKSSAMAASAGLTTTATSARAITAVLNAYGLSGFEASRVSDVLFQTVNKGVVSFEELAGVVGDFVGSTAAAGVSIEEASAALATMTLSGISANEAGTSLNRVMQSLIDPSDAMAAKMKELGYESSMTALEELGLHGTMELLRISTGGNIEELVKLFPETRAARGALALMADEGRNYAGVAASITDETEVMGAAQKAYNEQSKSFTFQLELAKNNLSALAIEIGTAVLPVLTSLVQMVTAAFGAFGDLPGPMKAVLAVAGGLAAAVALLGGAFLLLAPRIAAAQAVMASMAATSPALAGGLGMIAKSAGVIGLALGALTLAMSIAGRQKAELKTTTENLVQALEAEAAGQKKAADAAIASELARRGLIDTAKKLGVSLDDLARAARGDGEAFQRVIDQVGKVDAESAKFIATLGQVTLGFGNANAQVRQQGEALEAMNPALDETQQRFAEVEQILGPVGDALGSTSSKLEELDDIQKAYNESMKDFADGASVYQSVLDEVQGAQQSENDAAIDNIEKRIAAIRRQQGISEESKDAQIAALEEQKAALKDFTASAEISLAQYNAGLEEQLAAAREWSANYVEIYRTFGPQVATILASMGEEGRIIAAKMTADISGEGAKTAELLPQLYGAAGVGATTQLFAGLAPSPAQTREQAQAVEQAIKDHLGPLPGWTGDQATALTNFLQNNLAPATPNTAAQAEATANALRTALAGLPGWTEERAREVVGNLQAVLAPMPGNTGATAEATAEALRSRLVTLPGWTDWAGNETQRQWVATLARGTGGTRAETGAWASALVNVLNQILSGVGGKTLEVPTAGAQPYAQGGIRERHEAQIAPAGAMRLWAEPETGGEAYIPLAEAKKHRSVPILRKVAEHFGMELVEYAYGGAVDELGVPLPPTPPPWGHMLGRTNAEGAGHGYQVARGWVAEEKRKEAERAAAAAAGGGAPYSGGAIGSGWQQITGYLDSKGVGYTITSTYRPGDPGFHGRGKAVDLVGNMPAIFNTLAAGNPVPGINELFFDPMGYFFDEGGRASGAIGGHDDHVHAATFDKGGILMPGYTLAYNGTGRPELVSRFSNGGYFEPRKGQILPGDVGINTGIGAMNTGAFVSRLAYRALTGQAAVYDDDLNGRPDAWQSPNGGPPAPLAALMAGPPGLTMGIGAGAGASPNIDASVNIGSGAVRVEVRVSPGASVGVIDATVARSVNAAMASLIERLQTQLRARIKV